MATGFKIVSSEEFARYVDRYRLHPWLHSGFVAVIFGVIAGLGRSWSVGVIGGMVMFVALRFVVGPYASHASRKVG
jgi:hypothetical protein